MSGRWRNIQNALRLASPPTTSKQKHELFQLIGAGQVKDALELLDKSNGVFKIPGSEEDAVPLADLKDDRKRTALHWAAMSCSDRNISDVLIDKVSLIPLLSEDSQEAWCTEPLFVPRTLFVLCVCICRVA